MELHFTRYIQSRSPAEAKVFFLYPLCPDRLWGPPSLLSNGYWGVLSPGGKMRPGRDADHSHHLLLRSRMSSSYVSSPLCACIHIKILNTQQKKNTNNTHNNKYTTRYSKLDGNYGTREHNKVGNKVQRSDTTTKYTVEHSAK
jgi:hypothetical protein